MRFVILACVQQCMYFSDCRLASKRFVGGTRRLWAGGDGAQTQVYWWRCPKKQGSKEEWCGYCSDSSSVPAHWHLDRMAPCHDLVTIMSCFMKKAIVCGMLNCKIAGVVFPGCGNEDQRTGDACRRAGHVPVQEVPHRGPSFKIRVQQQILHLLFCLIYDEIKCG